MKNAACYQPDLVPESEHELLGGDGHIWHFNQTISSKLDNIGSLSEHIQKFCISRSKADSAFPLLGQDMNLVLSELLTNIVKYAYSNSIAPSQDCKIEVHARFLGEFFEVLIIDQGIELPKHVLERTNVEIDVDNIFSLPEGGFGWSIVHSIIDQVIYQRVNNNNRLLLRKSAFFDLRD